MPNAFSQLLQCILDLLPGSHSPDKSLLERTQEAMGLWKSRLLGPFSKTGLLENTQVFLIMSHDGKNPSYIRVRTASAQFADANQGVKQR